MGVGGSWYLQTLEVEDVTAGVGTDRLLGGVDQDVLLG